MFGCRLSGCFVVCLEDSTERSESNPGRSLGIITKEKRSVWKTVPPPDRIRYIRNPCSFHHGVFPPNTDLSD